MQARTGKAVCPRRDSLWRTTRRRNPRRAECAAPNDGGVRVDTARTSRWAAGSLGCLLAFSAAVLLGACKKEEAPPPTTLPVDGYIVDPITQRTAPPLVEFPDWIRTNDASLNEFIDKLLQHCVRGEYGLYRLAVSTKFEPLGRTQFEKAWHAVERVQIRNIRLIHQPTTRHWDPARTDIPEELKHPIYCVHGTIYLRELPGRQLLKKPVREVVVLVVKENGEWKLGPPAPADVKRDVMGVQDSGDLVAPRAGDKMPPAPATGPAA